MSRILTAYLNHDEPASHARPACVTQLIDYLSLSACSRCTHALQPAPAQRPISRRLAHAARPPARWPPQPAAPVRLPATPPYRRTTTTPAPSVSVSPFEKHLQHCSKHSTRPQRNSRLRPLRP